MICFAKFDFPIDLRGLKEQVKLLLKNNHWLAHYNQYQYMGDWEVMSLRSPGGDLSQGFAESLNGKHFQDTILLNALPAIKEILNHLKCEKMAVRLLNLKAGAWIKPHKDHDLCYEKGEVRFHFPIFTNEKVEFKLDHETLPMKEGECWYINANLLHEVKNQGNTDRIHLVVDCLVNDWLKQFFDCAIKKTKKEPVNKKAQLEIIESLKLLNTPTSHLLASDLVRKLDHE